MTTVRDIYQYIDEISPFSMQESWDNSGMLVGRWERQVSKVLVTLDITPEVIQEAHNMNAQLNVSHHPLIFQPTKQVTDGATDLVGQRILSLVEQGIAAICCHTSWDSAPGGVNDVLAKLCGLQGELELLEQVGTTPDGTPYGIGRIGHLAVPMPLKDYLDLLRGSLEPNGLRCCDGGKLVHKVAVGGGSCGSMMELAVQAGCDTFVTGDLKYDHFLDAKMYGLNLIDAGHYPTEDPSMAVLGRKISRRFPELEVRKSERHREVLCYRT